MPQARLALHQPSLFGSEQALPSGLVFREEVIPAEAEERLVSQLAALPLKPFRFGDYLGRRRVVSYGWRYDFERGQLREAEPIPAFLHPLREAAASFSRLTPSALKHVLLTEYAPGAAIGWHRDKQSFGEVVGISLLSSCSFRFRRRAGAGWERYTLHLPPRSAYLLAGSARSDWEHSIPAVAALRYSVTFRTLVQE